MVCLHVCAPVLLCQCQCKRTKTQMGILRATDSNILFVGGKIWGWDMNVAWQGFTCDIPLTQSSGPPLYFSIFTVNLAGTCCSLEYKVNLYIMAWSCLTSAELHSGARCCKVPTLVNCNILHITISYNSACSSISYGESYCKWTEYNYVLAKMKYNNNFW